jgi:D-3-phosphoglycerate dehydrogenase / 2-oxoglutarate reductase
LQLVVRAGAGTDTIDVAHCSRKGIYVANCPGKNAHAVSELTIGLLLSIDRRMAEGNQMLNEGKWNKAMFSKCKGLKGRTIGLVGYGAIAKLVCKTARALEMNVVVSTRTQHEGLDLQDNFKYVSRNELLEQSDIVSIHCPNTAETKGMVNKEFLELMKPDAVLLNTSRGSVINDDDLLAKLEACPDFWYGTDVFNGEPSTGKAEWSCPISAHPRVYGTHHCGASTA